MAEPGRTALVLLDACCLINLFASRRLDDILFAYAAEYAIASVVVSETLYVRRGGMGDDSDDRELVTLAPLVSAGVIQILELESDAEYASFVDFATELDDGEAMTCALALHRGFAVATDDRKALRILGDQRPPIPSMTTSHFVRTWATVVNPPVREVIQVVVAIRERARFAPNGRDPHFAWWHSLLNRVKR